MIYQSLLNCQGKKINLYIDFEDSMTIADEDIDENWEFYREKFLKGDIL